MYRISNSRAGCVRKNASRQFRCRRFTLSHRTRVSSVSASARTTAHYSKRRRFCARCDEEASDGAEGHRYRGVWDAGGAVAMKDAETIKDAEAIRDAGAIRINMQQMLSDIRQWATELG